MATNYSAAGTALGFGRTDLGIGMSVLGAGLGTALQDQVKDETDEERRRRLLGTSPLQAGGAGGISPAGSALFGSLR
jgi:hypothetical protein